MSVWFLLFIVFAVSMVIGPIMLLQPSSRQRYIALQRQRAAQLGLQVAVACGESSQSVMVYRLPVNLPEAMQSVQLMRQSYSHGAHTYKDWQATHASAVVSDAVKWWLDSLPQAVLGVEMGPHSLGLSWQDSDTSLCADRVKALLVTLQSVLASKVPCSHKHFLKAYTRIDGKP